MLAESPVRMQVTKQAIEVLGQFASSTDPSIRVYKTGIEVLRESPAKIDVTKQAVEVLGQSSLAGSGPVNIYKMGIEMLIQNLKIVQVTKQALEVMAQNTANSSPVKVFKTGIEVLFRSGPILEAPASLPSYWEVFANNWAQEVSMDTAYDTDISASSTDLTEDRRGLRDRPYRTINFRWTGMTREAVDRLVIFIRKITNNQFFVPLYQDLTEVTQFSESGHTKRTLYCDPTQARFYNNQRIAVVQLSDDLIPTDVQIYEIDEVEIDHIKTKTDLTEDYYPTTSVVFPCMDVEIELDPQITFHSNYTASVTLQADEITGKTALPPTWTGMPEGVQIYNDIPVFSWEPDWTRNVMMQPKREGSRYQMGRGTNVYKKGARYRMLHQYYLGEARENFWPYLKFFDSRRGRKNSFWHIDIEDIWKVSNINTVFLEIFEYGDFTQFQEDFDYVGIVTKDGQYFVREVVTIQSILEVYRITMDAALPAGITAADVRRVSRARLSRFQKDVLQETWRGNQYASIPVNIFELLEENTVEMT